MTNILTATEASQFARTETTDAVMLALLPMVDEYLYNATGHEWQTDSTINPTAKLAAGMLLVSWYDNPSQVGQPVSGAPLVQLEAEALKYRKYEFEGRNGVGAISLPGARTGDDVVKLVGVYIVTGDQSASFEGTITKDDQIQQSSASDLSDNQYVVVLKHPADDVRS
ncbi:MAG: phage gp6-like head-tail connector protein [Chloroflexi bacterium]|nr:phage gp6-like head-tail connector protein [Chloroflexota bacterium]